MSEKIPQVLRGFRDYLPAEASARKKIISKISETFERFGFVPLDTPALEYYELLGGKYGDEGEQLMYKFKDQGERDVALRYDLTVPLARVISNYSHLPKPFKRYQIANVWRAENTQRGRFREFMQCDVDIIGSNSLLADAEVIATLYAAFQSLEIGEVLVRFNNRQIIDDVLNGKDTVSFLRIVDKLDKIGKQKVKEMLKEKDIEISLDKYQEEMKEKGKDFVEIFSRYLIDLGVTNFEFDPNLARGLDYYTGTIFEFILKEKPEFGSIAGGGRYDKLIGKTSGSDMPAVGGSIGLDRLFAALEDIGKLTIQATAEVMVFNLDDSLASDYLQTVTELRTAGISAEFYYEVAKLDRQFRYAESKNAKVAVILGPKEAKDGKINLKDLNKKEQVSVDRYEIVAKVKEMLS